MASDSEIGYPANVAAGYLVVCKPLIITNPYRPKLGPIIDARPSSLAYGMY